MLFAWWFTDHFIVVFTMSSPFTWSSLTSPHLRKLCSRHLHFCHQLLGWKDMKRWNMTGNMSLVHWLLSFFGPWWICILNICVVFSSKLSWITCSKSGVFLLWMLWFSFCRSIVVTHFECSCPLPTWHMSSSLGTCVQIDVHNMITLSYTRPKRLIYYISYIIIHTLKESIVTYYVAIWYSISWGWS